MVRGTATAAPAQRRRLSSVSPMLLCGFMILFTAAVFLRDLGGFSFPPVVLTVTAVLAFLMLDRSHMICFLLFLFVFRHGIHYDDIVLCFFVLFFLKYFRALRFRAAILIPVLLIVFEMIHATLQGYFSIDLIKFLVVFLVLGAIILSRGAMLDYPKILLSYAMGALAALMDILACTIQHFGTVNFIGRSYRLGPTWNFRPEVLTLTLDPNEAGFYALLAVCGLLLLVRYRLCPRLPAILAGVFLTACGFLTLSRSFLVMVAAALLLLMAVEFRRIYRVLIPGLLTMAAILIVMYLCNVDLIQALLRRFQVEDISNGRIGLQQQYLSLILGSVTAVLFGRGLSTSFFFDQVGMATHSGLLDILAGWGIIGLLAVSLLFVAMYLNAASQMFCRRIKLITLLPAAVFMCSMLTLPLFQTSSNWLLLILLFSAAMLSDREQALQNRTRAGSRLRAVRAVPAGKPAAYGAGPV